MGSNANVLGTVKVNVVADYSTLSPGLKNAEAQAQASGATMGAAFTAASARVQLLGSSVDVLKARYDDLKAHVNSFGVATKEQYQSMQDAAARLTIAQQRLADAATAAGHAITGQQATSAFIRVGQGEGALRAVENFLANTLKLGPAMQAIFPVVGAIAFGEIIVRIGDKVYEFFAKASESSQKIREAFRSLNTELTGSNLELTVTSDKLKDQIAILSGGHPNTIKTMLDEAAVSAHKFTAELQTSIDKLNELVQKQAVSGLMGFLTGKAPTDQFDKTLTGMGQTLSEINQRYEQAVQSAHRLGDNEKSLAAEAEARQERQRASLAVIDAVRRDRVTALTNAYEQQAKAALNAQRVASGEISSREAGGLNKNPGVQNDNVALIRGEIEQLNRLKTAVSLGTEITGSKITEGLMKDGKKNFDEWLHRQEQDIELQKSMGQLGAQQEINRWDALIAVVKSKGPAYTDAVVALQIKTNELANRYAKERGDESAHRVEEQAKEFINKLKTVEEQAASFSKDNGSIQVTSGDLPKNSALMEAQKRISQGEGLEPGSYKAAIDELPKLTEDAAKESENALRRWVKTSQEIFEEGGQRTASETSANAAQMIAVLQQLGGMEDEIAAQQKRKRSADKQVTAQSLKVGDIDTAGFARLAEGGVQENKQNEQIGFEAHLDTTLDQQLQHKRNIAAFDEQSMAIRRNAAQAEFELALAAGNVEKAEQDSIQVLEADQQIRLHRLKTEQEIALETQKGSLRGRVASGVQQDFNQAGQSLAQSFGNAVANDGKIGQVFRNALKQLEGNVITTVLGNAFKSAVEASGLSTLFDKLGGIFVQTPLVGAMGTLTAAVIGNTAAQTTHAGVTAGAAAASTGASVAGAAASTAGAAANALAGFLPSIIGGAVGGVISGIFTLIGDAKIVSAIRETTAAVMSLRNSGIKIVSSTGQPQGTQVSDSNKSPSSSGFLANLFSSITGGGAMRVNIAEVSSLAPISGLSSLLGFPSSGSTPSASTASSVASSVSSFLPSIVGGLVGAISFSGGIKSNAPSSDSKKTSDDDTSSGGGFLANLFTSITGSGAMKVNVVAISPIAPIAGLFGLLGFAGGGRPPVSQPSIVGEKGWEMFVPDQAGTILNHDQAVQMLAGLQSVDLSAPGIPASQFSGGAGLSGGAGGSNSVVTNQNTGTIGQLHVHLSGVQNVDNLMRQISDRAKRMGARFSPNNLGPQTA